MDQGHQRGQQVAASIPRSKSMVTSTSATIMYQQQAVEHYPHQHHVNMRNEYV